MKYPNYTAHKGALIVVLIIMCVVCSFARDFPDFFIIGAMKCGTTSLNELLKQHPEICPQPLKEKQFFNHDISKGMEFYNNLFQDCTNSTQKTVDSTPGYMHDQAPKKIKKSYSAASLRTKKFIVILREPVARHYSQYGMQIRFCLNLYHRSTARKDKDTDESHHNSTSTRRLSASAHKEKMIEACERATSNYREGMKFEDIRFLSFKSWCKNHGGTQLDRGYYLSLIKHWLTLFPRDQLLILNFDSLVSNTTDVSRRLAQYLGLQNDWGNNVKLPNPAYTSPNTTIDCETLDDLTRHFASRNENLVNFINGAKGKPAAEPVFADFSTSSLRKKCIQKSKPFTFN